MYLEIYDSSNTDSGMYIQLAGICDSYSSVLWDVEYYESGQFEVYVAATAETMALFQRDRIVGRSDDNSHYGIIEGVYLRTDAENGDYLTISGRFLMCLLSRRIIVPTLLISTMTTYGEIVQQAVRQNCTTGTERRIPNLEIGGITGNAWLNKTKLQVSYENLMDWIYTICQKVGGTANIRLRETKTGSGLYRMVFELSQGTDRSIRQSGNAPVVFSDTYDNLLTYIYNSDYSEHRNYAYIYGEGEGAQRKSAVCYDTEEIPTGFDRYEIYVNASDLSQTVRNDAGTDTALTSEEYREMLRERGEESLVAPVLSSEATIAAQDHQFTYGVDYQVGDWITMQHTGYGISMPRVRLIGMVESFDSDGYGLSPVVQE